MVIDALLLCFVADVDDNDGTDGRPYYASDKLRVSPIHKNFPVSYLYTKSI